MAAKPKLGRPGASLSNLGAGASSVDVRKM